MVMQAQLFEPILRRGVASGRCFAPGGDGVLVRATNWLGDSLMTLPAVWRISSRLTRPAGLTVLCPNSLRPIWQACPWVEHVIGMAGKRIASGEVEAVRKLHPGLAIVLPNSFGAALDVWKCRIPERVGRAGRWRSLLLTARLPEWPRGENAGVCHQLSYYLELADCLGLMEWGADFPPLRVDAGRANALGTPGVAVFGSTDPIGTGPLGAPWHIFAATVPCRPCFRRTCPLTGAEAYRCLAEITPADVIGALANIL